MARIAFYAPLKSPHHPVPSGERQMARNLMQVLNHDGHVPDLVSEFRPFDKIGDPKAQVAFLQQADAEVSRAVAIGREQAWCAFVTYHSYYKAPDLLGPRVSAALDIPYVSIEATRAAKRLGGPWDAFERQAMVACDAAQTLFHFTARDAVALRDHLLPQQHLVHLAPFLAQDRLPEPARPDTPVILIAGMMRAGDKLASYERAAKALSALPAGAWTVEIAGDGPMRGAVESLMAPLGARVRFLGQLNAADMAAAYARAAVLMWPGVNEAFGMVYLEAQAHGVPVVAEDRPGVRDVVAADGLVPADDGPKALAGALSAVLYDTDLQARRAAEARNLVQQQHLLTAARETVWRVLTPLLKEST